MWLLAVEAHLSLIFCIPQDLEKQARDARSQANEKKKIAKDLKDEACKTRPGGKFICLRPFGSGY